mgnify:CR=1 FL=1
MRFLLCLTALSCALLSLPPSAHAQWSADLGATLGFSWASLDADSAGGRSTFQGGVTARIEREGAPLSLRSGLLFAQKGTAVEGAEGGELQYGANYLHLPVVLHAQGPSISIVTPYVQAGGFGSLKIFERQSAGGDGIRVPIETDESFFQRTDAGLMVGVGAELLLGERPLGVTIRYAHGLVDVAQDIGEQVFPDTPFPSPAQTRVWTVGLELGL